MKSKYLKLLFVLCLLTKSFNGWSQDDRKILKNDPSPFEGVVMTNENYRKTYEDLEACDIWKRNMTKKPACEDVSRFSLEYFSYGLIIGGIIGYTIRK